MLTAGKVTAETRVRELLAKQPRTRGELRDLLVPSVTPDTLKKTIQRGIKGDPAKDKAPWLVEGFDQKLLIATDSRAI